MTRARPEAFLKPKLLALSVAACFALNAAPARANPSGPTVVHGSVGFNGLGTSALTITNQAGGNAIINWNGFSIGISELTKFQQFANLAVLNRVTGSQISSILGSLQSDGRVFLINPNGIVFGASARIDVAGMVASSLNLSDQDFLSNRLRFTEVPGAGAVVNNGVIETASGGRVYLVAPTVENNGLIHAQQGEILLAAGKEVELVDGAAPFVTVKVTAGSESALNLGNLVAEGGRIGMFGALVRNSGTVEAGGAIVGPGGEIRLVATKDLTLDAGSRVAANGTSGGKILLQAEGGTTLISGTVEAKGSAGKGGEVSALGVRVGVVGHGLIDASGDTGGGTVLVGGDYQGKNAAVQNASQTFIGSDGVIRADAMTTGDGGRVIAWADGSTGFYGTISARGGSQSGNGGFVETSGKESLQAFGSVNVGAAHGVGGTWLLDPTDITIVAGGQEAYGACGESSICWGDTTSSVGIDAINGAMSGYGSIQIQATHDISLQTGLIVTSNGPLTLQAGNDINLGTHNVSVHGNLTLSAADFGAVAYGGSATTGAITGSGSLSTDGGRLDLSGNSISVGAINTVGNALGYGGGAVSIFASNGGVSTGSITTGGGLSFMRADVNINANGTNSNISTGSINTSGLSQDGANGGVFLAATGGIVTGSITTRSLHPSNGDGGAVGLFAGSGTVTVNGNIDTRGANGFNDGFSSWYYGGTSGGDVSLSRDQDGFAGTGITVNGSILTGGGSGVSASSGFYGNPHMGGSGGNVTMANFCDGLCGPLSGNVVVTGAIDTSGGAGGSTSNASAATFGGDGGGVDIQAEGSVGIASINTRGGSGGAGSDGGFGNWGGWGGFVSIFTQGSVVVGSIGTSGGAGGNGGGIISSGSSFGGDGGMAGPIGIQGASVTIGGISATGGGGGTAGTSGGYFEASGGDGGSGAPIALFGMTGAVVVGTIDASGGSGGAGGIANDYAEGGSGGDGAGGAFCCVEQKLVSGELALIDGEVISPQFTLSGIQISGTAISTGAIIARGGAGGSGGTVSTGNGYSSGGDGGSGGFVGLVTTGDGRTLGTGPVSTGMIDVSGGSGGNSGPVGTNWTWGGWGGDGGFVGVYGSTVDVAGPILAGGGDGGDALNSSILSIPCPTCTPDGGDGGSGGEVSVFGLGEVRFNVGGTLGTTAIDVSGGAGGNGAAANSPAGIGGSGGDGGFAEVLATPNMTFFGSIDASGGAGGTGGAGSASVVSGNGGSGGFGGSIFLDASSVSGSQTGDGIIFVLAGAQPFFGDTSIPGGLGGAPGIDGGAGTGAAGTAGSPGTFIALSDYFGTIVILDPLAVPGINEGFQQVVEGGDDTTAFVGGEKKDEEEDKSQKELGSCKG